MELVQAPPPRSRLVNQLNTLRASVSTPQIVSSATLDNSTSTITVRAQSSSSSSANEELAVAVCTRFDELSDDFDGMSQIVLSLKSFASVISSKVNAVATGLETTNSIVSANQREATVAISGLSTRMDQFVEAQATSARELAAAKAANEALLLEAEQLKQKNELVLAAAVEKTNKEAAARALAEDEARKQALVISADVALVERTTAQAKYDAEPNGTTKLALTLAILKCKNTQCGADGCKNVITTSDQVDVLNSGFDYGLKNKKPISFRLQKSCKACGAKKKETAKAAGSAAAAQSN
jgi:hypothetical protein